MTLIPVDAPRFEEMHDVVKLYVQNVNPTAISRQLGIKRVDVMKHIQEWRDSTVGMDIMKDRVEELIATTDAHYSVLIGKLYEIVAEVDTEAGDYKARAAFLSQKLSALKAIADLEAKRIDLMQKSGMLEAADLGDELAEMEETKQLLMSVLDEELCKPCKTRVMRRLRPGEEEVVTINAE